MVRLRSIIGRGSEWPDVNENGHPKRSCANARYAIERLGVVVRYDTFHDCVMIESGDIAGVTGTNIETAGHLIRVEMYKQFGFDPGKENIHDAQVQTALQNQYDPMREYFDGLAWDGAPRLDRWMTTYLGAENTELNRSIGRLTLVAVVRRVRQPGCKFDTVPVWVGDEGEGKSTALKVLAIEERNFSDQTILTARDQQQQELLRGVLIYELADLAGMQGANDEAIKAFASRTHDRARPAYGKTRVDLPRRGILVGTTNKQEFLKSQTGNRRWWPAQVGTIDLEALARDLDQLYAEAEAVEAYGLSLVLPRELWPAAREAQLARLERDPWADELENLQGYIVGNEERVFTRDLLVRLGLGDGKAKPEHGIRLAGVMRAQGWKLSPTPLRIEERQGRGYTRMRR